MTDIVEEIDRVLAEELAERQLDKVVDLAQSEYVGLKILPWQRWCLQQALQPGAFTIAALMPRRFHGKGRNDG